MGSTGTYKPNGQPLKEFFKNEFRWSDYPEAGLIDLATRGMRAAYAAVRHPHGYVFACAIKITYYPKDRENIVYRIDDESAGPVLSNCPKKILDLLTPDQDMIEKYGQKPDGTWLEWRQRCRANLAQYQALRAQKIRDGDVLKFEEPLNFTDGSVRDTFIVRRDRTIRGGTRTRFRSTNRDSQGILREEPFSPTFSITRWKDRKHTIIGHVPSS